MTSAFFLSTEKRYSNLCALCEDPVKCNYPDKYSGYEGAIRCLVENGGDVAFTKVIYVRRFFGVSFGFSYFEMSFNSTEFFIISLLVGYSFRSTIKSQKL